jgi:hypothetical protein
MEDFNPYLIGARMNFNLILRNVHVIDGSHHHDARFLNRKKIRNKFKK